MAVGKAAKITIVLATLLSSFLSLFAIIIVASKFGFSSRNFHDPAKVFEPTTFVTTALVLVVPVLLTLFSQRLLLRREIGLLGLRDLALVPMVRGCGIGFTLKGVSTLLAFLLSPNASTSIAVGSVTPIEWLPYFSWFLVTLVLNSLNEELVYRVFPLRNLEDEFVGPRTLVWATAIVFSLMHFLIEPPDFFHFLYRLGFGLLAGELYLKTRSLWQIVGLHTGWNFVALSISDSEWRTGGLVHLAGLTEHIEIRFNIAILLLTYVAITLREKWRSPLHLQASGLGAVE